MNGKTEKPALTIEMVLEALDKVGKRLGETEKLIEKMAVEADRRTAEFDRKLAESVAEADKRHAESVAEFDRRSAEFDKKLAESVAEADKRHAESVAEFDRRSAEFDKKLAESVAEFDRRSAEFDKKLAESVAEANKDLAETKKLIQDIGKEVKRVNITVEGVTKSNGDLAEEVIFSALDQDKTFGGIKFDDIYRNLKGSQKDNPEGEYDVVLKNGDTLAIIETKYKVRKDDIDALVKEKANRFRNIFPQYKDYKIILGIGGMSFNA